MTEIFGFDKYNRPHKSAPLRLFIEATFIVSFSEKLQMLSVEDI
jgi:hypothetical protein